ncbi:hypothetical protein [Burkholderia vietnamiensis]|uniref:hypothetical protein n=1 Tax=Burkholderia vietnamiensis TaxID=60552 RepID=UPI001D1340D6|nr:hypothetical protein [Burkholderia vietnamiensis]UEC03938.1 hypothetical protein LK462_32140 [Burkholderia vietnamiensis]
MSKAHEYVGVVYDIVDEVVIERHCQIRETREEAMRDAQALCELINANRDEYGDRTVDRETDAYVMVDGEIEY